MTSARYALSSSGLFKWELLSFLCILRVLFFMVHYFVGRYLEAFLSYHGFNKLCLS